MKGFWQDLRSIFLAKQGTISSKRVCGVIGWLVCVGILIYCTIMVIQAPVFADAVLIATAALLGVDSITGIWKVNRRGFPPSESEEEDYIKE